MQIYIIRRSDDNDCILGSPLSGHYFRICSKSASEENTCFIMSDEINNTYKVLCTWYTVKQMRANNDFVLLQRLASAQGQHYKSYLNVWVWWFMPVSQPSGD